MATYLEKPALYKAEINIQQERMDDLLGTWKLSSINFPIGGLCRKVDDEERAGFVFQDGGQATVHVDGKVYETTYFIVNDRITFRCAALTGLLLIKEQHTLRFKNHLGATLVFHKQ